MTDRQSALSAVCGKLRGARHVDERVIGEVLDEMQSKVGTAGARWAAVVPTEGRGWTRFCNEVLERLGQRRPRREGEE